MKGSPSSEAKHEHGVAIGMWKMHDSLKRHGGVFFRTFPRSSYWVSALRSRSYCISRALTARLVDDANASAGEAEMNEREHSACAVGNLAVQMSAIYHLLSTANAHERCRSNLITSSRNAPSHVAVSASAVVPVFASCARQDTWWGIEHSIRSEMINQHHGVFFFDRKQIRA